MKYTAEFRYIRNLTGGDRPMPKPIGLSHTFEAPDLKDARQIVKKFAADKKLPKVTAISNLVDGSTTKHKKLAVYVQDPLLLKAEHADIDFTWKKPKGPRGPKIRENDKRKKAPTKKAPAKKASTKKAPTKKASVKKAPVKKTAAKKGAKK
jgi:hypothetical protein